jgi:hypothetical protein
MNGSQKPLYRGTPRMAMTGTNDSPGKTGIYSIIPKHASYLMRDFIGANVPVTTARSSSRAEAEQN